MNIRPDLEQKAAILLNAVYIAKLFGYDMPRVGVLAAVELVNPAMPATVDAACLAKMADRRQYIPPASLTARWLWTTQCRRSRRGIKRFPEMWQGSRMSFWSLILKAGIFW